MNQLLVISSYPDRGSTHFKKTVGIASYTKNTLIALKKFKPGLKALVLAEKLPGEIDYESSEASVKRVWKRGSFLTFPYLFFEILKNKEYRKILFEFEVSMFGNMFQTAPLPLFIILLRLAGKEVTIVLHQVISNLEQFAGHTNIKGLRSKVLTILLRIFYFLITTSANRVIVFEDSLKENLGNKSNVSVIVHGVEKLNPKISKDEARKVLKIGKNKKIILVFGYVAWYKGTDWIAEQFKKVRQIVKFKDYTLIIAGGPNPNHLGKKFYTDYISAIKNLTNGNIKYTGFVKEIDIPHYFKASDAVILPYRAFMSASGPLSLAYSFDKPAFLSSALSPILETADLKKTIKNLGLTQKDLSFDLTSLGFRKVLEKINNPNLLLKVALVSKEVKDKRDFNNISKKYFSIIFNEK